MPTHVDILVSPLFFGGAAGSLQFFRSPQVRFKVSLQLLFRVTSNALQVHCICPSRSLQLRPGVISIAFQGHFSSRSLHLLFTVISIAPQNYLKLSSKVTSVAIHDHCSCSSRSPTLFIHWTLRGRVPQLFQDSNGELLVPMTVSGLWQGGAPKSCKGGTVTFQIFFHSMPTEVAL